jgi:hypothetical protein
MSMIVVEVPYKYRIAFVDDLRQYDATEDLGIGADQRSRQSRRRRSAAQSHGQDVDRQVRSLPTA